MKHYTEQEVKNAQEVLKVAEEKKAKMQKVKEEIASTLKYYEGRFAFKFRKNQVIFSVWALSNMLIGVANCTPNDKFNSDLGKLIAIRKALGKDIKDLVELAEPKNNTIKFSDAGITISSPGLTISSWGSSSNSWTNY